MIKIEIWATLQLSQAQTVCVTQTELKPLDPSALLRFAGNLHSRCLLVTLLVSLRNTSCFTIIRLH